jgi:ElaB/YqjD/DUF883 family membrane-anchored ribosome-binding protein
MSTANERLAKQAKDVKEDLREMRGTVRDAAQETVGQFGEAAAGYFEQGRDKDHGVACACEQFVRERPLSSVLMAAGVGWLFGRFGRRR